MGFGNPLPRKRVIVIRSFYIAANDIHLVSIVVFIKTGFVDSEWWVADQKVLGLCFEMGLGEAGGVKDQI